MSDQEFGVVATLYPQKGKAEKLVQLLQEVSKHVREHEPGTLRYEIHRSLKPSKDGVEDVVMIEQYRNRAALNEHASSPAFLEFQKQLKELDLIRAPMKLSMLSAQGGFTSRL